jgi:hypothetical protein
MKQQTSSSMKISRILYCYKKGMKYRIVKRKNKYVPQHRFLWCWRDYSADPDDLFIEAFDTQEEAEEFIENEIEDKTEVVVKIYE